MSQFALPSAPISAQRYRYVPTVLGIMIPVIAACYLVSSRALNDAGEAASFAQQEFARLFDLWGEGNIPAWYTSFLWVLCAYFALKLDRSRCARHGRRWAALSALFLYMSLDEVAGLHESGGRILTQVIGPGEGAFFYTWVYLGIAATGFTALAFLRFVLALPRDVLMFFIAGAAVFVGGALVLEMVQAASNSGSVELPAVIAPGRLGIVEELAEMLGIVLAMNGLIRMMRHVEHGKIETNRVWAAAAT